MNKLYKKYFQKDTTIATIIENDTESSMNGDEEAEDSDEIDDEFPDMVIIPDKYYEILDMVPIHNDHMRNIIAGSTSSIVSKVFAQPLETLKQQYQLQQIRILEATLLGTKKPEIRKKSLFEMAHQLYVERDWKRLWKNHLTFQFAGLLESITLFWAYEQLSPILTDSIIGDKREVCNFTAGFISGGASVLVARPVEMIYLHRLAQKKMKGSFITIKAIHSIIKIDGLRAFYRGSVASMLYVCPLYGCKFMFYNKFCDDILEVSIKNHDDMMNKSLLGAGAVAGVISHFLNYPMDLIRRRLHVSGLHRQIYRYEYTCRRVKQCMSTIVRNEGVFGLYRGVLPCMLRSAVSASLQFTVFERVRDWGEKYL